MRISLGRVNPVHPSPLRKSLLPVRTELLAAVNGRKGGPH